MTVYDCSKLAEDCSQCKSLNTSRYTCSWCSNKKECGYGNDCDEKCPAPNITKVNNHIIVLKAKYIFIGLIKCNMLTGTV